MKRLRLNPDSGLIFLASGLAAGVLNYLFQVIAKRHLADVTFSELTGWFSDLSVLFLLGGLLQNWANFKPASQTWVRRVVIVTNVLGVAALWLWFALPGELTTPRALLVVLCSILTAWISGQVQIRLAFGVLSAIGFLMAIVKLSFTQLPFGADNAVDRYALGLFIPFIVGLWISSIYLWRSPTPKVQPRANTWAAATILSITVAVVPIFDLVILYHSVSVQVYALFATASLFFRAIYFLVSILAQWMLPRQIRNESHGTLGMGLLFTGTVLLSVTLSVLSPYISTYILNANPPGMMLVFMSCLHTSLLALLYLQIQSCTAGGRLKAAGWTLVVLGAEAAIQLGFQFEILSYLAFVSFCQSGLMIFHILKAPQTAPEQRLNIAA